MKAITSYRQNGLITSLAMRFSALTFCRPGEIRKAEWTEIDFGEKLWRIPPTKMKGKRLHLVPLAPQSLKAIEELKLITCQSRYLFPSRRSNTAPMSEAAVLAALRSLGYEKDQMCAHGFRGMASTALNEKGLPSDWIELQLAHTQGNSVRAAYNHAQHLDGRRKMMMWWADYLDALEFNQVPPKIPA